MKHFVLNALFILFSILKCIAINEWEQLRHCLFKMGTRRLCLWHPGDLIKEAASWYLTVFFTANPAHHYLQNSTSKFKIKSTWWNPRFQILVLPSITSWTKDVLQRPVALTTVQQPYLLGATLALVKPTPPGPPILRLLCLGLSFDFRKSPERT